MTLAGSKCGWVARSAFLSLKLGVKDVAQNGKVMKRRKFTGSRQRKKPLASLSSMNFLGSLDEIHSA
jgi:hypothetical protein